MIITYHGSHFVKVQQGDFVLAYNPVSKDSKEFNKVKFGADVAVISTNHPDFNGVDAVSFGEKAPLVLKGPGEYETGGMFVKGWFSKTTFDGKDLATTIFELDVDDAKLVFIGGFPGDDLPNEIKAEISEPDILFVPVNQGLSGVKLQKAVTTLEPSVIIPIGYDKDSLKEFLKAFGAENVAPVEKLTVRKKDLVGKNGEVIVLSS